VRCVAPMLTRAGLPGGCRPACRSSIIDETNALLCRPLGALYSYIQNARIGVELEDRDVPVPITALNTFTCNDLLLLSRKSRRFDRWFAAVSWIACPPGNKPRGNPGGRRQPCFWISASLLLTSLAFTFPLPRSDDLSGTADLCPRAAPVGRQDVVKRVAEPVWDHAVPDQGRRAAAPVVVPPAVAGSQAHSLPAGRHRVRAPGYVWSNPRMGDLHARPTAIPPFSFCHGGDPQGAVFTEQPRSTFAGTSPILRTASSSSCKRR